MVKSRRAASSRQSSAKAIVARRPSVETSRRKVVISTLPSSNRAVTVPWSIPVGTVRIPASPSLRMTSSGRKGVAASTSATGLPASVSRTAPPTHRLLSLPSAATSAARLFLCVHSAAGSLAIDQILPCQPPREIGDDRRSDPPDAVPVPVDLDIAPHPAREYRLLLDVVGRVEHMAQGRLEPV